MGGVIQQINFSAQGEKAVVCFENGYEVEFRNAKKNRADHVRKLQLKPGEEVIVIGAHSDKNPLYVFGFDIQRCGKLQNESYSIIRGQISQLVKMKSTSMIYIGEKKKQSIIKADSYMTENIHEGDEVTCICLNHLYQECINPCDEWNINKCKCCQKRQSDKRYTALDLERRIS